MSDPAPDDGLYEFVAEPLPGVPKITRNQKVDSPDRVMPPYRRPADDKPPRAEPEAIKDWYLPLGLIGGGVVVDLLSTLIWEHSHLAAAISGIVVELTLGTAVMLVAMLIAAKLRGIDLGKIGIATLKLAAIAIAPAAASQFLSPILSIIPFGGILVWVGQFVLFFALLGAFFDLDENDTWYCVCIMFITELVFFFASKAVLQN